MTKWWKKKTTTSDGRRFLYSIFSNSCITLSAVISLVHSNCRDVPLWSGHQFQSPASNRCRCQHPEHFPFGADIRIQSCISFMGSVNPLIMTVRVPVAQLNQLNPLLTPINTSDDCSSEIIVSIDDGGTCTTPVGFLFPI